MCILDPNQHSSVLCRMQHDDAGGLPSREELANPASDGQDLFRSLRAWERARRHEGHLAQAGSALPVDMRRDIFTFLCKFAAKKTVFREQTRELLERLASFEEWRQGGALEDEALVNACGAARLPATCAAEAQETPCIGAGMDPCNHSSVSGFPGAVSAIVSAEDSCTSISSGDATPKQEGHEVSFPKDAFPEVCLPSTVELANLRADAIELFGRISTWVLIAEQQGCLTAEGCALSMERRRGILDFLGALCIKKSACKELAQKVLGALIESEWCRDGAADNAKLFRALSRGTSTMSLGPSSVSKLWPARSVGDLAGRVSRVLAK